MIKKIIYFLIIATLFSCSTAGRVCGGRNGARSVQIPSKITSDKLS